MKKLITFILTIIILSLGIYFLFRGWPVKQDCSEELTIFNPDGNWISEDQEDPKTISLIKDDFFSSGLVENNLQMGKWNYSEEGYIDFKFSNLNQALRDYLKSINENPDNSEIYRQDDSLSPGESLSVKIFYDQYTCNFSNVYFYFGENIYHKKQFNDILEN